VNANSRFPETARTAQLNHPESQRRLRGGQGASANSVLQPDEDLGGRCGRWKRANATPGYPSARCLQDFWRHIAQCVVIVFPSPRSPLSYFARLAVPLLDHPPSSSSSSSSSAPATRHSLTRSSSPRSPPPPPPPRPDTACPTQLTTHRAPLLAHSLTLSRSVPFSHAPSHSPRNLPRRSFAPLHQSQLNLIKSSKCIRTWVTYYSTGCNCTLRNKSLLPPFFNLAAYSNMTRGIIHARVISLS
jgi:hypothetical protein